MHSSWNRGKVSNSVCSRRPRRGVGFHMILTGLLAVDCCSRHSLLSDGKILRRDVDPDAVPLILGTGYGCGPAADEWIEDCSALGATGNAALRRQGQRHRRWMVTSPGCLADLPNRAASLIKVGGALVRGAIRIAGAC